MSAACILCLRDTCAEGHSPVVVRELWPPLLALVAIFCHWHFPTVVFSLSHNALSHIHCASKKTNTRCCYLLHNHNKQYNKVTKQIRSICRHYLRQQKLELELKTGVWKATNADCIALWRYVFFYFKVMVSYTFSESFMLRPLSQK